MASGAGRPLEGADQAPAVVAEKRDGIPAQRLPASITGHGKEQPHSLSNQLLQHRKILKKHAVICQGCGCQIGYVIGQARGDSRSPALPDLRPF